MEDLTSVVDWSRAQFALTAAYHWIFVPLTLGLSFMIAWMETRYVRTGDPFWKQTTQFWMRLFGVNFAVGVATGLILEFEFGTNWSNYSYFVGDIFGAPLAIEGIMAFFMESTFIAVMFFGWNRVSKRFHLASTWLVAVGASLSALWILVANAWMQYPVGTHFNPDTARNEMIDFWAVAGSPVAMNKFFHTVSSSFILAAVFVVGVGAWFLLRGREERMARKSMTIAAVFGLFGSLVTIYTGDGAGQQVARHQPMKLAAMEGLEVGSSRAPLTIVGDVKVPGMLSLMSFHDFDAFVPGTDDLVYGNPSRGIPSTAEKMKRGRYAKELFAAYREQPSDSLGRLFDRATPEGAAFHNDYFRYFGYGYLQRPEQAIPPVPLVFWSFRVMVGAGVLFMLLFGLVLWFERKGRLPSTRWLLHAGLWSIPLAYLASQAGWVVAEVGRQPWVIQDLLPTSAAVTQIGKGSVQTTFWILCALFAVLLVAEIRIMVRQIRRGSTPADHAPAAQTKSDHVETI